MTSFDESIGPVAIIGSGIAGLTAARELSRANIPVRIFEATGNIAGMARTHVDEDGFTYDCGAHFITNRLASSVGIPNECLDVRRYGESVLVGNRLYNYPLGLVFNPRYALSAVAGRLTRRTDSNSNATSACYKLYGRKLADEVCRPLLEAWSGIPSDQLAPSVFEKLAGGSVLSRIWLKSCSMMTGRAVASGYSRELPETRNVWHVYPKTGVSAVCQALADSLPEGTIVFNSPVQSINCHEDRVNSILVNGETISVPAVISTAPVNVLPNLVNGSKRVDCLRKFRFRAMIFVNLKLTGRHLLPNVVLWLPGNLCTFRITEAPISMPWLAPEGKTLVTVDIGVDAENDELWNADDEQLVRICLRDLKGIVPDIADRYLGNHILRTKLAYPVFDISYEEDRKRLASGTNIDGLFTIGRNGQFDHILMEDVFELTRRGMQNVKAYLQGSVQSDPLRDKQFLDGSLVTSES